MSYMTKFLLASAAVFAVIAAILRPIVLQDDKYRVVVVNVSEHVISHVNITRPEGISYKMTSIHPGHIQDYYFIPEKPGKLEYTITQNNQVLTGVINDNLEKEESGDIYVVLNEAYRVKIHDEYEL